MSLIGENFREVVLTGGPAAGKSSALKILPKVLKKEGIRAISAPEVATILMSSGIDLGEIKSNNPDRYYEIEKQLIYLQMSMRRHFQNLARSFAPDPVCILYDRGELDTAAYLPRGHLRRIIQETGISEAEVRDSYDAVIYLRSSASLGPDYYSKDNNPYRFEDAWEARISDSATLRAWLGHPHLWIVEPKETLDEKLERLNQIILHVSGVEGNPEIERKFLIEPPDMSHPALAGSRPVKIEQVYLPSIGEGEIRVRHRRDRSGSSYHWAEKTTAATERREREMMISKREYNLFLQGGQLGRIEKTRYHLAWAEHHLEIDHINSHDLWIAEVELLDKDDKLELPPFLQVKKEVTGLSEYSNKGIATS